MSSIAQLAGALVLTLGLGLAFVVPRPPADNSVESFLQGADEASFASYTRLYEDFGSDELVVIELQGPAPAALSMARRIEETLAQQPAVVAVAGFPTLFPAATEVLLDAELGGFDNLPAQARSLDGPINRALGLFSPADGRTASLVTLGRARPEARASLREQLEVFRAEAEETQLRLRMAGNPLVNLALDQAAKDLETQSLPLLVTACVLLLVLFTGSLRVSIATLLPVGLAVFASEGLLGLFAQSTNLIVGISKPLVFVILLASSLHILVAYEEGRQAGLLAPEAAWRAAARKRRATLLALLTTAVGFLAMLTAPVQAMRTFGVVTSATLVLGLLLLLFTLPTLLAWSGGKPSAGVGRFIGPLTAKLVGWSMRQRLVLPIAMLFTLIGASMLPLLEPDPHAIRYLAATHPLRQDHEGLEKDGRPLSTLELVFVGTSTTWGLAELEALRGLHTQLLSLEDVHAAVDLSLLLREAQFRASGLDALPDLMFVEEARARPDPRLRPFWNPENGRLRMSLLVPTLDARAVWALSERIHAAFTTTLEPLGFRLEITGNHVLIMNAQNALLSTLLRSLLLTAFVLQILLMLGLRSVRLGLIALLPSLLPVTLNFALMKLLGIPLDVGTSMTAAIALGIAVDDTLHFLLARAETQDLLETARSTGRALFSSSVIIGMGFLVLTPSDFSPTRHFGLLAAAAMLSALVGNLVVLPRLLRFEASGGS